MIKMAKNDQMAYWRSLECNLLLFWYIWSMFIKDDLEMKLPDQDAIR